MNNKLNLNIWWHLFLLLSIAILIFIYSESYEKYFKIDDFTEPISIENDEGFYYDITREYPPIELEGFDTILNKLFQRIKYNEICFRDEGSKITEEAFKGSNLIISVFYSNETKEMSYKTSREENRFF